MSLLAGAQTFLTGYTKNLLEDIALTHNIPKEQLFAQYLNMPKGVGDVPVSLNTEEPTTVKKTRKPREVKPVDPTKNMCTGLTAKGQPCKFAALPGMEICGIHNRKLNGAPPPPPAAEGSTPTPAPVKVKAPKKAPKVDQVHNHPVGEKAEEICQLCESHGDLTDPGLTDKEFEAAVKDGQSIQDRLKAIISAASGDEDEEDEEEPTFVIRTGPDNTLETVSVEELMKMDTEDEKEEEEEEEEEEEDSETLSLKAKLAKMLAAEDDEDEDEDNVDQMCDTPPSRDRLADMLGKMKM
tara:strand:- start:1390 stop:2277 length:888 start_codon:yes stop_codon:yes gene_type:complete